MNWYRVKSPHDNFSAQDVGHVVLLEGGAREASLELLGYLEFVAVDTDDVVLEQLKPKRGRRGKQASAGPPEVESVEPVSGDEVRGGDSSAD